MTERERIPTAAYYNDNDPRAAAWLRELIKAGLIPDGDVDERSICDVRLPDLYGYTQCHFFAGIGGWPYALRLAGWPADRPVWTGSCPCQPFSQAGKRRGRRDARHLWPQWCKLIAECGAPVVFGEQVASPLGREWLGGVQASLEAVGYAVGRADVCAAGVGAPHIRQRLWWVAESLCDGRGPWGDERPRQRWRAPSERASGSAGGVADADGGNGRASVPAGHVRDRADAGRAEADGESATCGATRGVADAGRAGDERDGIAGVVPGSQGAVQGEVGQQRLWPDAGDGGAARGVGDANTAGPQGRREHAHEHADEGVAGAPGAWGDHEWLPFTDGRARRVESGTSPLAHGVSGRVGLLRGYGNAIVPHVAAEFVGAFLDCEGGVQ